MTTTQTASSAPASAGAKPAAAKATMTPLNKVTTANANAKPAAAAAPAAATGSTTVTKPQTSTQLIQKLDAAKAAQVTASGKLAQANTLPKSYTEVAMARGVTADAINTIVGKVRATPDQVATIGAQTAQPNLFNPVAAVIKAKAALATAQANVTTIDQQLGEAVDAENAAKAKK